MFRVAFGLFEFFTCVNVSLPLFFFFLARALMCWMLRNKLSSAGGSLIHVLDEQCDGREGGPDETATSGVLDV